jgi:hypothetical protein
MWRRLLYLGIILLWLIVMCFPITAFVLATRGEIKIGNNLQSGLRIFLVQGEEAQGVGFDWSRRLKENPQCSKTIVRYLLWEGGDENFNIDYCLCYEQGENGSQITSTCQ